VVVRTTPGGTQVTGTPIPVSFGNGVAGGWIGYLPRTSDQGGITTEAAISGVTVTVTVNTSRRLKVTGYTSGMTGTNVDTVGQLTVKQDGVAIAYARVPTWAASLSYNPPAVAIAIVTPSAGSHTYALFAQRVVGTGSVTVAADTDRATFILVEDLGPA
jgi:hypothetical protein